ncbi:MAG TPA: AAA family ATPase [Solirubrobacteraceae bacterium]|jgi:hypothetical protein|nr:AAA family ATPase [Solirubrobacteraceae bacterium]
MSQATETKVERRAWDLLTRDFCWDPPAALGVKIRRDEENGPARLQVFEVAVAAAFARLRPDYEWYVTPNLPDGGSDFVGKQQFLLDDVLDIAAAITVGGQCKKRTRVDNVVEEVSGSLVNMAVSLNPTFFVVALSAHVSKRRIKEACARIEAIYQRHCHILDRPQIESIFNDHRDMVDEILEQALSADEIAEVHKHLGGFPSDLHSAMPEVSAPDLILAGEPFAVTVRFRGSASKHRVRWTPPSGEDGPLITLIGPIGADRREGASASVGSETDTPIDLQCILELVTYSVGRLNLGEISIVPSEQPDRSPTLSAPLGAARVVENLRPRFYERPFKGALLRLEQEYDRAVAGGTGSIGVVGSGGSGKSRLCEEFALRKRREGSAFVVAKQAKTLDDPHRILADLLLGLLEDPRSSEEPAERVIRTVERFDSDLAERARPAIRSIFGLEDGVAEEQPLLSVLLLLITARGRRAPLIVHLQDLHWCSADVLLVFERMVWQLDRVSPTATATRSPESGVFLVFEGRVGERQRLAEDGWDSESFGLFLQKLGCPTVPCSFSRDQGLEFIQRLFEDRHSAKRRVNVALLDLQRELIQRIHRTAGGNPFHSLQQVQILKEQGVVGQNPLTGLLHLIRPAPTDITLPESVFEAIRLRWTYLQFRTPQLALLIWAAALLEDRVPTPLFRRLWRTLAPDVSLRDVDATEVLWTAEGEEDEISFRHENYFRSIRRFEVSEPDRKRAAEIYCDWFAEADQAERLVDRYKWALALLQFPVPDLRKAEQLMRRALRTSQQQGDIRLARRVAAASLDLAWRRDAESPVDIDTFLHRCEDELALATELLGNERTAARQRLDRLCNRLATKVSSNHDPSPRVAAELRRLQLTADVRRSQILFTGQEPLEAAEIAANAVNSIRAVRAAGDLATSAWEELEMEALHTQAVALAISGESERSLASAEPAVRIARRSSSVLARHVVSTYANILLPRDPKTSEVTLRQCLKELDDSTDAVEARVSAKINLAMALVLIAYRTDSSRGGDGVKELLDEATQILKSVFSYAFRVGRYPDAGSSALMLGIVSVVRSEGDEIAWFAQAVTAAARGQQMETLWRAHVNLATAMNQTPDAARTDVRNHAIAALEILAETLSPYPEPDRSPRFELVRVPLAQAVRLLRAVGDPEGPAALARYPALRSSFADEACESLRLEESDRVDQWWLAVNGEPYYLY